MSDEPRSAANEDNRISHDDPKVSKILNDPDTARVYMYNENFQHNIILAAEILKDEKNAIEIYLCVPGRMDAAQNDGFRNHLFRDRARGGDRWPHLWGATRIKRKRGGCGHLYGIG